VLLDVRSTNAAPSKTPCPRAERPPNPDVFFPQLHGVLSSPETDWELLWIHSMVPTNSDSVPSPVGKSVNLERRSGSFFFTKRHRAVPKRENHCGSSTHMRVGPSWVRMMTRQLLALPIHQRPFVFLTFPPLAGNIAPQTSQGVTVYK